MVGGTKSILLLLDCQEIWHTVGTSLEQKLSAGPDRYKEEESCSGIIAVVPGHVRIVLPFSGFPLDRFCHLLLSVERFRRLPSCYKVGSGLFCVLVSITHSSLSGCA